VVIYKTMLKETLDLLMNNDFYGEGKNIEIAKGKNQYVSTIKDARRKIKRIIKTKY